MTVFYITGQRVELDPRSDYNREIKMKIESASITEHKDDACWYMYPLSVALMSLAAIGIAFGSYTAYLGVASGY